MIDEDFDGDLDGWTTCGPDGLEDTGDEDCNDGLSSVNPGEPEVCDDGVDNDCNGGVDDGCNVDADGDGVTVEGPDGVFGTADDDCDDDDPNVHPGAPEVLDHLDNDCDGIANEEVVTFGTVVITEILKDVHGADDCGEFFELYNNSGVDLALTGWTVEDSDPNCTGSGDTFTVPELVIPAAEYVVLARGGDTFCNNALELAGAVIYPDSWVLANNEDEIYLCADAFMVDAIEYDETSFPSPTGSSFGLDPAAGFAVDNNDGALWCVQTTPFLAGGAFGIDFATPALANDPC